MPYRKLTQEKHQSPEPEKPDIKTCWALYFASMRDIATDSGNWQSYYDPQQNKFCMIYPSYVIRPRFITQSRSIWLVEHTCDSQVMASRETTKDRR